MLTGKRRAAPWRATIVRSKRPAPLERFSTPGFALPRLSLAAVALLVLRDGEPVAFEKRSGGSIIYRRRTRTRTAPFSTGLVNAPRISIVAAAAAAAAVVVVVAAAATRFSGGDGLS